MRSKIVFELINESPGLSYNEIARKTNFSNGVISHYLNKLLQEGEIEKEGIEIISKKYGVITNFIQAKLKW